MTLFANSIQNLQYIEKGEYKYFILPLADGIPEIIPELLHEAACEIISNITTKPTKILTIESMGIPIATVVSLLLDIPLTIVRKRPYNLPGEIHVLSETGYSTSDLYINGISSSDKLLIIDDVISTGGTLSAILQALPCTPLQIIVLFEKGNGKEKITSMGYDIKTIQRIEV